VSVRSTAAMLWDCEFVLPSGRWFAPLARAHWAGDSGIDPALPGHLRHLGGEFVCVPFGIGGAPEDLLPAWASDSWKCINPRPHGLSADAAWELMSADSTHIQLRIAYPAEDDIDFLTRRISIAADASAIDLELRVHARRLTHQPIGLHPILRLPEWPSRLTIDSDFEFGMTYPARLPPGASRVALGQRFTRLDSIPGIRGGMVDYSSFPKEDPTEEMLLLCKVTSPVTVHYAAERAFLRIEWDTSVLPSCLLWPSDRALTESPCDGRFRGLGVEPVAAVFDASREFAVEDNFLNKMGVATAVHITPEAPLVIRYRLEGGDE
jgi:hypothetical protein